MEDVKHRNNGVGINQACWRVLEKTTIEVNRVLRNWKTSVRKEISNDDINSLFKSYLSRLCKSELGYAYYRKIVRHNSPTCTIKDNRLAAIHIADIVYGVEDFKEALDVFEFNLPRYFASEVIGMPNLKDVNVATLINYEQINNIKF